MRKKMLAAAAAAASLMLAATAAGSADASQHAAAKVSYFKSTVSPNTGVTNGKLLTLKGTGAKPSTSYYCVIAVYSKAGGSAPQQSSLRTVRSNAAGKVSCKVTYHPFSAQDGAGVTRHCPTTAADRRAHYQCGVALADSATVGAISESVAKFTPAS